MKKKMNLIAVMLLLVFVSTVMAGVEVQNNDTKKGQAFGLNFSSAFTVTNGSAQAGIATIDLSTAAATGEVQLPIGNYILNDGTSVQVLTTTSIPGLELDNKYTSVVWADGELTPVSCVFQVPADYGTGGSFVVYADESGSTTACEIDFNVYVSNDGVKWPTSASNQTPVALAGDAGTPCEVALSVATDFASLAAGSYVQFSYWRDNTATGTNDLEAYHAKFVYTRAN